MSFVPMAALFVSLTALALTAFTVVFGAGKWRGTVDEFQKSMAKGSASFNDALTKVAERVDEATTSAEHKISAAADRTEELAQRLIHELDELERRVSKNEHTLYGTGPGDPAGLVTSNTKLREVALHGHASIIAQHTFELKVLQQQAVESQRINERLTMVIERWIEIMPRDFRQDGRPEHRQLPERT